MAPASVLAALELGLEGRELGERRIRVRLAIGRTRTRRLLEAFRPAPLLAARAAGATVALEIGTRATIALGPILPLRPVVATRTLALALLALRRSVLAGSSSGRPVVGAPVATRTTGTAIALRTLAATALATLATLPAFAAATRIAMLWPAPALMAMRSPDLDQLGLGRRGLDRRGLIGSSFAGDRLLGRSARQRDQCVGRHRLARRVQLRLGQDRRIRRLDGRCFDDRRLALGQPVRVQRRRRLARAFGLGGDFNSFALRRSRFRFASHDRLRRLGRCRRRRQRHGDRRPRTLD